MNVPFTAPINVASIFSVSKSSISSSVCFLALFIFCALLLIFYTADILLKKHAGIKPKIILKMFVFFILIINKIYKNLITSVIIIKNNSLFPIKSNKFWLT